MPGSPPNLNPPGTFLPTPLPLPAPGAFGLISCERPNPEPPAIAKSLKSKRLLLMTNVEGVLDKNKKLIQEISSSKILEMIKDETITEGMIPKINTCLDAVNNGVTAVAIIDGRKKHSILFEIFSDKGSGTLIRK